ncbi:acetolactate synthase small subunit [Granulosicoccus antarcticus]|uniref:Acetolactate synthase small subunit n=1 Tax=Granulosicoccus antarcticus IMCC3135 TaxID=1192854 RepID=A0A2Z2P005_9GAMM|nr:acetolactate synthase small subunit [Granulosicoccus antarcticus]ASJ75551.1 Acetolactate synthase isozyme 3 small subunit [Granulosicoccus antarcticus IMCC3135]
MRRHVIAVLLENESGALSRVAGLFSARGYNIESLTVAATHDPTLSRMTIVTIGTDRVVEQIIKQLNKLVDVVRLTDLTEVPFIEREIMMVKVRAVDSGREELKRMTDIFRGRILDVTESSYVIELTGDDHKLSAFLDAIGRDNIIEAVRSGATGIARGDKSLKP